MMKCASLLLTAATLLGLASTSEALPRRWGGYNSGYYNGYGPAYGGYGGYSPYYGGYGPYYNGYNTYYGAPGNYNGFGSGYPANSYRTWVGQNWYATTPYSTRSSLYQPTGNVTQAQYTQSAPQYGTAPQEGLRIDEVVSGGAAQKADLRTGDIIIGVGPTRTQTFEELQQALATASGATDIAFFNAKDQKVEKVRVTPVNGKIGVAVTPVNLP